MKLKQLRKLVQARINKKVAENSKHFSSEVMERQIEALIEIIAPLLKEEQNGQKQRN